MHAPSGDKVIAMPRRLKKLRPSPKYHAPAFPCLGKETGMKKTKGEGKGRNSRRGLPKRPGAKRS